MRTLQEKKEKLTARLKELGRVAVAYSSGVDSTFLLAAAHETLGENVTAVIGKTASFPEREYRDAVAFCEKLGVRYSVVEPDQMAVEGFRENPPERCYLCKRALFSAFLEAAQKVPLADGTNADDSKDYRPGMRALRELGIVSPLREAGLTKADIRELSREMGLPTWNKPSFACLATRIPCGEEITEEKLRMIEKAEECLFDLGFTQVRVRHHGDIARIEIDPAEMGRFLGRDTGKKAEISGSTAPPDGAAAVEGHCVREIVTRRLKEIGFRYVTVDLGGYQTGSTNRTI